jgi:hypothetical protein
VLWATVYFSHIRSVRQANAILVPALGWLVYVAWEWWVLIETPEANIRLDLLVILLVIWPLLVIRSGRWSGPFVPIAKSLEN